MPLKTTASSRSTTVLAALAIPTLALSTLAIWGCSESNPPVPPAAGASQLVSIDGIDITFADVDPLLEYLRSTNPDAGHKTMVRLILETHLIPLALAERSFAKERAVLLEQAKGVRQIASNVYELEQARGNVEVQERRAYTRLQPDLPVAAFLFNRLNEGGVSQPIPVPRGFVLAGTHEYTEVPVAGEDMVEATQVGFFTHKVVEWQDWLAAEQTRIADQCTYVHPEFRDALPTWCKPPQPKKGR
ncbi:MAG: hypothetical protein NXI31_22190 [bacterium]|nr:hypothetical protein [bacterium]